MYKLDSIGWGLYHVTCHDTGLSFIAVHDDFGNAIAEWNMNWCPLFT